MTDHPQSPGGGAEHRAGPEYPPSGYAPPHAYPPAPQYAPQLPYGTPVAGVPVIVQPTKTNGMAIASLVLGLLWIWWVGSVLALVFGYVGKNQIDQSGGLQGGRGLAIAGIVLGWIGVGTLVLVLLLAAGSGA